MEEEAASLHVVKQPRFIFFLRIAQAVIALIALALTAAALAEFRSTLLNGSLGFVIFVCIATWIITAYNICTPLYKPSLYNCWAVLGLEIFGVVFWLPAFASVGAWASVHDAISAATSDGYDCNYYGNCGFIRGWRLSAAAAGMGGLEFIIFFVTLITFSVFLHRHRMGGAPTSYGGQLSAPAPAGRQPPAEMNNLGYAKEQGMPAYPPQPVYAGQAYVK